MHPYFSGGNRKRGKLYSLMAAGAVTLGQNVAFWWTWNQSCSNFMAQVTKCDFDLLLIKAFPTFGAETFFALAAFQILLRVQRKDYLIERMAKKRRRMGFNKVQRIWRVWRDPSVLCSMQQHGNAIQTFMGRFFVRGRIKERRESGASSLVVVFVVC